MPSSMVLLLNGAIDLSLLILCFLWGSSWCVAVLMTFKCPFRGNSGKLNCHIGRILQETKIWMKKINKVQNVISWLEYLPCFACRSVSGLCNIYSVPYRSSVFWNWQRMGAKFVCPFPSPGSVLPAPSPACLQACTEMISSAGMQERLQKFPFKEAHKPLAVISICDSAVYPILIKHLTSVFWFCFAGRNHSCFQLCMLPLYLVVGT